MKAYYGNYLGICISNTDPEYRGRVKVFVPHIMPALYEHWNQEGKDIQITAIGKNLQSALDPAVVDTLAKILPWCEASTPVLGTATTGHYNADTGTWIHAANNYNDKAVSPISCITRSLDPTKSYVDDATNNAASQQFIQALNQFDKKNNRGNVSGTYCAANCIEATKSVFGVGVTPANAADLGSSLNAAKYTPVAYDPTVSYPAGSIKISGFTKDHQFGHAEVAVAGRNSQTATNWLWSKDGGSGKAPWNAVDANLTVWIPPTSLYQNVNPSAQINSDAVTTGQGAQNCDQPATADTIALNNHDQSAVRDVKTPFASPAGMGISNPSSEADGGTPNPTGAVTSVDNIPGVKPSTLSISKSDVTNIGDPQQRNISIYGSVFTDLTSYFDTKPGQRPTEATNYWTNTLGAEKFAQLENNHQQSHPKSYGSLTLENTWKGAFVGNLIPGFDVGVPKDNSYGLAPGSIFYAEANGKPLGPNGGYFRVADTGSSDLQAHDAIDYYTGNDTALKDYFKQLSNQRVNIQPVDIKGDSANKLNQFVAQNGSSAAINPSQPSINLINRTTGLGPAPIDTSLMPCGMFAVPNVGSLLWIFFQEGNPLFPVYFGASFSRSEWQSVYKASSPPAHLPDIEDGSKQYAQQSIMRMNGAGAIISTDTIGDATGDLRSLNIISHTGAHFTLGAQGTIAYDPNAYYKQTDGHSHDAAFGDRETYTEGDSNTVTHGDYIIKIGNISQEAFDAVAEHQAIIEEAHSAMDNLD
jgi:hypothetical protein